ncbi:hypothetical protein TRFO_17164 [Tritrichomonas foetus]|uniref:Uncharacterized protein n=1 Tax=Tritrichomonas foetus TaxID=1144522 RepID=A0A1J4KNC6_9EUKA|nr:hypothetical protein TRFO_17164 [Tritrichomonas foetus]|eukprot:OHT12815.1 hypothetical protein TRFO_17164 [Tritrichomonas foetus]
MPKKVIELLVETNRVNYNFDFRINISVIERIFKLKKSEVLEQYIQSITNDKDSLINALNFSIIYQKPKVFDNLIQNPLIEVQDALITAIMNHQNENIIKMLLEHPTFDINFISKDGKTALIAAVLQKSVKITNNILNYSSNNKETNVDLVVNNEVSALSCCLTLETFKLLKEKGAKEINRFNCDGKTILYSAIESSNYQLFDHIIFLPELDVNKPNKDGNVPLFAAGQNTSFHYTEKLLERQDLILNENECNYGIISGALKQKNYQCCLNLLKRGVQCDNDSLVTILKNATDKSDVSNFIPQKINPFINFAGIPNQFLDKVLERIDLTLPQPNKGYNVHIMYQFIDYEKIDLFQKFFNILITSDSESIRNMINWQKQSNGNTFLIYSCKKKFDPAIKLMLDCSPNINLNVDIKNKHGKNCLQFLVNNKQFDFVPKVIEKSKDYQIVNEIFSNQETLLNSLIINNQTNLFKTITTHYKDTVKVDLRGKFQMLPIEHAIVRNHFEIAEFILNTFPDSDIGNSLQLCLLRPNMMNLFLNKKKEEIIERMKNDPKYRDLFFNRLEFHKDEQINNIVNDCAEIQRLR